MKITWVEKFNDLAILEPDKFDDNRGFFYEAYNSEVLNKLINRSVNFVQDNQSFSFKNVLRGMHYQKKPYEQAKLVRVVNGKILDIAIDMRVDSKNFGKWHSEIISSDNQKQFWIPEGYAHGFIVLSDTADILYKTNNFYNKKSEINFNAFDPFFNIKWPLKKNEVIWSENDKNAFYINDISL